ncbi:hypothetical protein STSP2_00622 [Anaerohalosphaera lusitana]|uniref:Uncharacterized protein n=1 Tax=Anaerohalosphaera lusitana TaxID=1936003 RepID=A0A1U9NI33_9BACT|nr:hypothetical protein STSP2_00622 [Anaerohalosphaera lusitana]
MVVAEGAADHFDIGRVAVEVVNAVGAVGAVVFWPDWDD